MGDLTTNFSLNEFSCKDGTSVPSQYITNVLELAKNLEVLRNVLNRAIIIVCGYRTVRYNEKCKGAPMSQHLEAKAADILVDGFEPEEIAEIIEELIQSDQMCQGGLGIYDKFVHYDIRGIKKRWRI